jgi:predicted RNase H-like HicB family nuclease/predicted RNA binding protein YcfA (HicA-like mRNA interferase family)
VKVRDVIRLVESDGWRHVRTTASHRHYTHSWKPNVVTIPGHPGDELPKGSGEETMNRKYAVIFEQAETNWAAYVPDLPGCITTGKTLDESERNIREAISGHLATLQELGETVPEPTSIAREVEVAPAV